MCEPVRIRLQSSWCYSSSSPFTAEMEGEHKILIAKAFTFRNSTFIFCGMQAAEGILYVHVPSEISFPVCVSYITSSVVM